MSLAQNISRTLRALREQAGLSQQQLAKRAGVSLRYISNVENDSPNVTVDVIEKLAKGLGTPPGELLGDAAPKGSTRVLPLVDQTIRLLKSLRSMLRKHPG